MSVGSNYEVSWETYGNPTEPTPHRGRPRRPFAGPPAAAGGGQRAGKKAGKKAGMKARQKVRKKAGKKARNAGNPRCYYTIAAARAV